MQSCCFTAAALAALRFPAQLDSSGCSLPHTNYRFQ